MIQTQHTHITVQYKTTIIYQYILTTNIQLNCLDLLWGETGRPVASLGKLPKLSLLLFIKSQPPATIKINYAIIFLGILIYLHYTEQKLWEGEWAKLFCLSTHFLLGTKCEWQNIQASVFIRCQVVYSSSNAY